MRTIRSVLFVIWLYGAMAVIGAAMAPFLIFNANAVHRALRIWAKTTVFGLRWIVGARLRFEGLENIPHGPALIAAKHQSMLDTLAPSLILQRTAFVFKRELLKQPVLGWYLDRGGMIPVDREAHASALKNLIRYARAAIADGRQIVIFPEGTRQAPGAVPDYKPGVAAIYRDLKLPCTPIALNTGLIWPAHGLMRSPGEAVIRVLPPIPAGLSREDFMRELETKIENASNELLSEAAKPPAPPPKEHGRLWLYLPWGAFVIGAVAWCFYWFTLAHQVETRLTHWVAAQNQSGGEAHIGHISRHGFPAMLRYEMDDVSFTPHSRAFALSAQHLKLHVNLTEPQRFYLEPKSPIVLTTQGETSTLNAASAVASFRIGGTSLTYAGVEADHVTLDNPRADGVFTISHIVANARPDPRNNADWQIALLSDAIHLARPVKSFEALGQDLPRMEAAIVWTAAQRARFEGFETQWGAVHANLTGELGLDDAHRLDGRIDITTPRDALRFMSANLRMAVLALQPTQDPIKFSLQAESGALRAQGRAVRDLKPLY